MSGTNFQSKEALQIAESKNHAFIEASAGSGKTTLLTHLVRELVSSGKAKLDEILCVTFTDKAAAELRAKIFAELQRFAGDDKVKTALDNFSQNRVGTIHSFCLESLSQNALWGLQSADGVETSDEDIFEEAREWAYRVLWNRIAPETLEEYLKEVEFGKGGVNRQFDADIKQKALFCFALGREPVIPFVDNIEGVKDAETFRAWTLVSIIHKMKEIADERSLMTFSLMVTRFANALDDAAYADKIRSEFRYALIDEFQDTDAVQWKIFKTLFLSKDDATRKLVVVGDPKQAIFKFRGADVFVYLDARRELQERGALSLSLDTNYRSSGALIDFFNTVFGSAAHPKIESVWQKAEIEYRAPQVGVTDTHYKGCAVEIFDEAVYSPAALQAYAQSVTERIRAVRASHPQWTVAVIAYKHYSLSVFAEALRSAGVEFAYYKQAPDFSTLEFLHLKTLCASLTLEKGLGFTQASETIFLKARDNAQDWYSRLHYLASSRTIVDVLQMIAQDGSALLPILERGGDAVRWQAWRVLMQALLGECGKKIHDLTSLLRFLTELEEEGDTQKQYGDMLRERGAVTLITVQSAKGLDWDMVVVADGHNDKHAMDFAFYHGVDGQCVVPVSDALLKNTRLFNPQPEEEAHVAQLNLLYVAITRPKSLLLILNAAQSKGQKPGPVANFLNTHTGLKLCESISFQKLSDLSHHTPLLSESGLIPLKAVDHQDIQSRYRKRSSFSDLVESVFQDAIFIEDILPRGTKVGSVLHGILETCNFQAFGNAEAAHKTWVESRVRHALEDMDLSADTNLEKLVVRIYNMFEACALAVLPVKSGPPLRLCDIETENLWREMPFWSSSSVHKVLSQKKDGVEYFMHGFMDLVFTPDNQTYYILDYKSNSLATHESGHISDYIDEHYALQAQIYIEALSAYLEKIYPESGKTVAGFYFVFLRYLESGQSVGVHFIERQKALEYNAKS